MADCGKRVLLRTATSKDAAMAAAVLGRAGVEQLACADMAALVAALADGAGALLVAEETLTPSALAALTRALDAQPPWSDLPVLVLARQGADTPLVGQVMERLPNVTIIERPVRVAALVSAVRSALRARRRQYELRRVLDGLREADRRKDEFLATLAHELRNPLAPLSSTLALLSRGGPAPPHASEHYAMMRRQVDHMVRLVDDLMEVSRITRGHIDLHCEPLALHAVLQDAIALSRPLLDAAQHTLSVSEPAEPLLLRGDGVRLAQVFSNLLNNAAKYTPQGGRIRLAAHRDGDDAVVDVADSGAGVPGHMLESIFEMFVQAEAPPHAPHGGLGIGLTLVRSIVEMHGGRVGAASDGPGRGATFTVRLPLAPAAAAAATAAAAAPWAAAGEAPHAPLAQRVLVVDDNRDAADALAELLRAMGATASTAYDADEALRQAQAQQFDCAVLDIGLAGSDGCDLARALRAQPRHRGLALVALTGWGQPADRQRIAAAGFDHHLLKPASVDDLVRVLSSPRTAVSH